VSGVKYQVRQYVTLVRDYIVEADDEFDAHDRARDAQTYPDPMPEGWEFADVDDDFSIEQVKP
jgi:hypothetical protein